MLALPLMHARSSTALRRPCGISESLFRRLVETRQVHSSGGSDEAAIFSRKILKDFFLRVHPDVLMNAPPTVRENNLETIQQINELLDALQGDNTAKNHSHTTIVPPSYQLKFFVPIDYEDLDMESSVEENKYRVCNVKGNIPKALRTQPHKQHHHKDRFLNELARRLLFAVGIDVTDRNTEPKNDDNVNTESMKKPMKLMYNRRKMKRAFEEELRKNIASTISEATEKEEEIPGVSFEEYEHILPFDLSCIPRVQEPYKKWDKISGLFDRLQKQRLVDEMFSTGQIMISGQLNLEEKMFCIREIRKIFMLHFEHLSLAHPIWKDVSLLLIQIDEEDVEGETFGDPDEVDCYAGFDLHLPDEDGQGNPVIYIPIHTLMMADEYISFCDILAMFAETVCEWRRDQECE